MRMFPSTKVEPRWLRHWHEWGLGMSEYTAPQQLHDLAYRYARGVDTRDAAILAEIFTDDGVIRGFGENPIRFEGQNGLQQMCAQLVAAFPRTMHNVYNQTFECDPEGTVTGVTNCMASHILPGEDWQILDMALLYHNRYACENGHWKFSDRALEVLWVETRPVQKFTAAMMDAELKEFQ
jgi:SnoaL-like domain